MDTSNVHNQTNRVIDKTREGLEKAAHTAMEKGGEVVHAVAERGAEFKKVVKQRGEQAYRESETFIKEHPHSSVLYALGVGALVGAVTAVLVSRSCSRDY